MSRQERTLRALELIARSLNEEGVRGTLRRTVGQRLERAGVRVLDSVVERLVGGEIDTLSKDFRARKNRPQIPHVSGA